MMDTWLVGKKDTASTRAGGSSITRATNQQAPEDTFKKGVEEIKSHFNKSKNKAMSNMTKMSNIEPLEE